MFIAAIPRPLVSGLERNFKLIFLTKKMDFQCINCETFNGIVAFTFHQHTGFVSKYCHARFGVRCFFIKQDSHFCLWIKISWVCIYNTPLIWISLPFLCCGPMIMNCMNIVFSLLNMQWWHCICTLLSRLCVVFSVTPCADCDFSSV